MKTVGHILAAAFVLMPWCVMPLFSQQNDAAADKKITITKRSVDADGSETTETIIKKENIGFSKHLAISIKNLLMDKK